MNIQKIRDREELDQRLVHMPWYVDKFIHHKLPDLSPSSLLEYVRDYDTFLGWLRQEGLTAARTIRDIPLADLEKLHMDSIDTFRSYLSTKKEMPNAKITITRKLSSLRSLFHYLSQIAEDENFYPLLKRNVMAKVEIRRTNKSKDIASKLEGKLLQEHEITEFINYIREGYGSDVVDNKQAHYAHQLNKTRDACIVSLILHSGLRVSETTNLTLDDLDMKKQTVYVYRKGNNEGTFKTRVFFRQDALDDLSHYLSIRETQYLPPKKEKALFLTIPNGKKQGQMMSKRAIQEMVMKYAKRFGKPYLTVHKLRHSFATDYYLQNDLYKTQEQLGHASPDTTQIYAHLTDKTMAEAIDNRKE
ncbi:tyrosine recombinase XerS [Paenibacillus sp. KN14-4R]|uniref:tyrosine recombinase XerS n=1 Tax=Paenibacillus sp. KN14-4R TaxID=3445773 RepID=UPI003FA129B6